jgi:4-aminobutyrate aminotransferase-like enzyme
MESTATHSSNPASSSSSVLQLRQKHYGKNAALSYNEPLHIVRGQGCYLYDEAGAEYLDCVNNVASVGHANPQVICSFHAAADLLHALYCALQDRCSVARLIGETLVAVAISATMILGGVGLPMQGSTRLLPECLGKWCAVH